MNFTTKLQNAVEESGSLLCVGLDPVVERLPATDLSDPTEKVHLFCRQVIEATAPHCCAYKLNTAFFEALGSDGIRVFEDLIDHIGSKKIIIADAKRADIAHSAEQYKKAFFETFDVDAVTLNPLMGFDTLQPFLNHPRKAIYILTLTSNPGAEHFFLAPFQESETLSDYIADRLKTISETAQSHIGMVVGATQKHHIQSVLRHYPAGSLLIPGVGRQGGSIDDLVTLLQDHKGIPLITSSRSIIYAGEGHDNWQDKVEQTACEMKTSLKPLTQKYV